MQRDFSSSRTSERLRDLGKESVWRLAAWNIAEVGRSHKPETLAVQFRRLLFRRCHWSRCLFAFVSDAVTARSIQQDSELTEVLEDISWSGKCK